MFDKARARMRERYAQARIRETRFLMTFDIAKVNNRLLILLSVFIFLNFFDAITTLLAINAGPTFVELNPIASNLFHHDFIGFVAALGLKYIPIIPLVYATFLRSNEKHVVAIRVVKVSAFIALVAADLFYLGVVGSNSFTLARYYFAI